MPDTWNVTAAYDKPLGYNVGDTMTINISGNDVLTQVQSTPSGTATLTFTAADGSSYTTTLQPVPVSGPVATPQSIKLTGVADSSGRVWTIAPSGLSASATA